MLLDFDFIERLVSGLPILVGTLVLLGAAVMARNLDDIIVWWHKWGSEPLFGSDKDQPYQGQTQKMGIEDYSYIVQEEIVETKEVPIRSQGGRKVTLKRRIIFPKRRL